MRDTLASFAWVILIVALVAGMSVWIGNAISEKRNLSMAECEDKGGQYVATGRQHVFVCIKGEIINIRGTK